MNANRGYVGWSMSVRASEAYEAGEMPKSKWTKAAMLAAIAEWLDDEDRWPLEDFSKLKKADLFGRFFEYKSWHHTSKHFNVTDFYGLDEYAIEEASRPATDAEVEEREAAKTAERERQAAAEKAYRERCEAREALARRFREEHGYEAGSPRHYATVHPETASWRKNKHGQDLVQFDFGKWTPTYSAEAVDKWGLGKPFYELRNDALDAYAKEVEG